VELKAKEYLCGHQCGAQRLNIVEQRCYALEHLLRSLEGELERNPRERPRDPFRNIIRDDVIIMLCARHVMNGGELPERLDAYVLRLINEDGTENINGIDEDG
jgi:phosphate uptake regulator